MTNEVTTKVEIVIFKMFALHINEPYVKLEKPAVLRNCGASILILCHMLCLIVNHCSSNQMHECKEEDLNKIV